MYASDMFYSMFKDDPMNSEQGRRYRKEVLEKGGSEDEIKQMTNFLGRAPRNDAFLRELGLV